MINISDYKNIHCIGIGGIGLSAIAEILLSRGYNVSGSDMTETEITEKLKKDGATIYRGHRRENVENADLIVYSAAIADENPEIQRAKELNIKMAGRAEVLGTLMDEFKESIAISGTHGKTTTTSMVSLILEHAALDPTILVGGNLDEIGGNVKVGKNDYFITEACEYRDSFLQLRPDVEVILNIDSDHLDYFKDINHIVRSFRRFASNVENGGKLIAYGANPFVSSVIDDFPDAITFGYGPSFTYSIENVGFEENGMPSFEMVYRGENLGRISMSVPGEHNILNAAAAFACCHQLGVDTQVIIETLGGFKGTHRRFDIVGKTDRGVTVVDDYAHHPTEIKATLSAAHRMPHKKLWCIFQPHTYTRTLALFDEFAPSFEYADVLIVTDIYAAREKNIYSVTAEGLSENIRKQFPNKEIMYMSDFDQIADYVYENAQDGDLVITMGAGHVYKIGNMIMER